MRDLIGQKKFKNSSINLGLFITGREVFIKHVGNGLMIYFKWTKCSGHLKIDW